VKYLLNLIEKDDGSDVETDLFEPSVSHFAELFMEQEKMKVCIMWENLKGYNFTEKVHLKSDI
jgi:hypothetical protein